MTTNYERIKNMTVDEMASYIAESNLVPCRGCSRLPVEGIPIAHPCDIKWCIDRAKSWLQEESEE